MIKNSKCIFIDTITREFLKFAKIMGILPSIYKQYLRYCSFSFVNGLQILFTKNSFYNYAKYEGGYYRLLNEEFIRRIYFFAAYDKCVIENTNELVDLFISHLKSKGYPKYIRIIH